MTRDSSNDPQPPSQPWIDRSLTPEELRDLKIRLSKMLQRDLVKFYEASIHMCQLAQGQPPRAAFIQQLVAAWKELQRRQKAKT